MVDTERTQAPEKKQQESSAPEQKKKTGSERIAPTVQFLEEGILRMNARIQALKRLYKLSDETAADLNFQALSEAIEFQKMKDDGRVSVKKAGFWQKNDAAQDMLKSNEKNVAKLLKSADKYRDKAETIEQKGGTIGSRFHDFFHFDRSGKLEKVADAEKTDVWTQYISRYRNGAENEKVKKLHQFQYAMKGQNQLWLIQQANKVNEAVEEMKQARDKEILIRYYGVDPEIIKEDAPVYAYYSGGHRKISYQTNNGDQVVEGESQKEKSNTQLSKRKELEEKMKASGVAETLDAEKLLCYMSFQPNEFDAVASQASEAAEKVGGGDDDSEKIKEKLWSAAGNATKLYDVVDEFVLGEKEITIPLSKVPGVDWKDYSISLGANLTSKSRDVTKVMTDGKLESKALTGLKEGEKLVGFDNQADIDNLKNVRLSGNEEELIHYGNEYKKVNGKLQTTELKIDSKQLMKQLKIDGAMDIGNGALKSVELAASVKELKGQIEEYQRVASTGDKEEAAKHLAKLVRSFTGLGISGLETLGTFGQGATKLAAGTGKAALGATAVAADVLDGIGSYGAILTGVVDTIVGIVDAEASRRQSAKAKSAKGAIAKGESMEGADKKAKDQALRFLDQVKISADQNHAEGTVDAISGAAKTVSAVLSLIPATAAIGSAVGTIASVVSAASKMVISKIFRQKAKDTAWANVMHMEVDAYKNLAKDAGGVDAFHDVLRRVTGVATRQHYVDSLNITDGIDIYTTAKTYHFMPEGADKKMASTLLGGVGYGDPAKYPNITLEDILTKVKAPADWKGELRKATTDNIKYNLKEDMHGGTMDKALSGKYDKKKK